MVSLCSLVAAASNAFIPTDTAIWNGLTLHVALEKSSQYQSYSGLKQWLGFL